MHIHVVAYISASFLFLGKIIFHCMDLPPFVYAIIHRWTFGLLPAFGYCCVAINMYFQVSEYLFSVLWGVYLGMEFGGSDGNSV